MRSLIYHSLYFLSFVASKTIGIHRSLALFKRLGDRMRRYRKPPKLPLSALRKRLERGYRWIPFPVQCLDQAIVTWSVLNYFGHQAQLKIGIQLAPFLGHAWVETPEETFVEVVSLEDYKVIAEYPPWEPC